MSEQDSLTRAQAWIEGDPDPETRAELQHLILNGARAELEDRMGPELDFGTAGLRGAVGAGPSRMNRAVLVRAVRAFAEHLLAHVPNWDKRPVVVGYDARLSSRALAEAAVSVLSGAGIPVRFFAEPVPTPLVAYLARILRASGALVVTASHNPREDNGLKLYGPSSSQLASPADVDVARRRDALGPAAQIPGVFGSRHPTGGPLASVESPPADLLDRYLSELFASLPAPGGSRDLSIAYTPLHGLGLAPIRRALSARGFTKLHVVPEQALPDGHFPTAPSPNPELPGTLAAVLSLAERTQAELVLANDPDVDRLAAAAREPSGRYHVFSGNQIAALLADFVLEKSSKRAVPLLVSSVVSTPLLLSIAQHHGAVVERTLTGFKWIWAAAMALEEQGVGRFAFGCEEALGYSVGSLVRDKDGISAAVWLVELAAHCRLEGKTLLDRLHGLCARHGAWGSAQRSIERRGPLGMASFRASIAQLAKRPPESLAGKPLRGFVDYRVAAAERPAWLGTSELFELHFGDCARVLVRPSGTEPKLKIYADWLEPLGSFSDPAAALDRAGQGARLLVDALVEVLSYETPETMASPGIQTGKS